MACGGGGHRVWHEARGRRLRSISAVGIRKNSMRPRDWHCQEHVARVDSLTDMTCTCYYNLE